MPAMKILFITATRLGDAILSTGLLEHLRQTHPEARVTVACGVLAASIFEGFPNVEHIIPMIKQKRHGHWFDLWRAVVGTKWDMVIDLRNSVVSRLVYAKQRFMFGRQIDPHLHKVEQAGAVMKLAHVPDPVLHFTPAQTAFAQHLIPANHGLVLGVAPAANWIGKTWPAENFIKVIDWLTVPEGLMPNARVAVFAAPGEAAQAKPVLDAVPMDRRIDGIGQGTPGEAAASIVRCDFFIGNDSGLMHAAAASGVPTIGLFGPSYPHLYGPWGDHAAYVQTPETFDELVNFAGYNPKTLDRSLMISLKPDRVIDIIKMFDPVYESVSKYFSQTHRPRHPGGF